MPWGFQPYRERRQDDCGRDTQGEAVTETEKRKFVVNITPVLMGHLIPESPEVRRSKETEYFLHPDLWALSVLKDGVIETRLGWYFHDERTEVSEDGRAVPFTMYGHGPYIVHPGSTIPWVEVNPG